MFTDEMAEYTPLRSWLNGNKNVDESVRDFAHGIENDLEQLSNLLGIDLVIMAVKPRRE